MSSVVDAELDDHHVGLAIEHVVLEPATGVGGGVAGGTSAIRYFKTSPAYWQSLPIYPN